MNGLFNVDIGFKTRLKLNSGYMTFKCVVCKGQASQLLSSIHLSSFIKDSVNIYQIEFKLHLNLWYFTP